MTVEVKHYIITVGSHWRTSQPQSWPFCSSRFLNSMQDFPENKGTLGLGKSSGPAGGLVWSLNRREAGSPQASISLALTLLDFTI